MSPRPFAPDTTLPCTVAPSPNHGDRRGRAIDTIVLHYTGMRSAQAACARLCDPASEVSSHYLIDDDGRLLQLVPEARRAWHAGRSFWRGERDMNSASIGIEIANPGHDGGLPAFLAAQVDTVVALCRDILNRHQLAPDCVLGHSDIAPGRKIDPGERFPWPVLAAAGAARPVPQSVSNEGFVVLALGAQGASVEALNTALARWGYDLAPAACFNATTRDAVASLQRRFRPAKVDGVADEETLGLLRALITALPA